MLTLLLAPLLACAPADLDDPFFEVDQVPDYALLDSLGSARIMPDDLDPIGEPIGLILESRVAALDWSSEQVQVGWSAGGVLWTFWVDRQDLVSAVPQERWVDVGDQGAGVRFPAGLRLDAQWEMDGLWVAHEDGLEPIQVPQDTLDQVFPDEVYLRWAQYTGSGHRFALVQGALLRDGVDGQPFAWFDDGINELVNPDEREGEGWWVSWDARFGTVQAWVADADLVDRGPSGGGWGGSSCGGVGMGIMGYGFGSMGSSPSLPVGTVLMDAPDGVAFARTEQPRWERLGEPVGDFYPVQISSPWGEQELWAFLP